MHVILPFLRLTSYIVVNIYSYYISYVINVFKDGICTYITYHLFSYCIYILISFYVNFLLHPVTFELRPIGHKLFQNLVWMQDVYFQLRRPMGGEVKISK